MSFLLVDGGVPICNSSYVFILVTMLYNAYEQNYSCISLIAPYPFSLSLLFLSFLALILLIVVDTHFCDTFSYKPNFLVDSIHVLCYILFF